MRLHQKSRRPLGNNHTCMEEAHEIHNSNESMRFVKAKTITNLCTASIAAARPCNADMGVHVRSYGNIAHLTHFNP